MAPRIFLIRQLFKHSRSPFFDETKGRPRQRKSVVCCIADCSALESEAWGNSNTGLPWVTTILQLVTGTLTSNSRVLAGFCYAIRCWTGCLFLLADSQKVPSCPMFSGWVSEELIRRGLWATIRIEHEHQSNAGRFRSVCWVPPLDHRRPACNGKTSKGKPLIVALVNSDDGPMLRLGLWYLDVSDFLIGCSLLCGL